MYINTQQSEAAEAAFKKAIELDPNYADAYYQLGLVLIGRATVGADQKMGLLREPRRRFRSTWL